MISLIFLNFDQNSHRKKRSLIGGARFPISRGPNCIEGKPDLPLFLLSLPLFPSLSSLFLPAHLLQLNPHKRDCAPSSIFFYSKNKQLDWVAPGIDRASPHTGLSRPIFDQDGQVVPTHEHWTDKCQLQYRILTFPMSNFVTKCTIPF